MGATSGSPAEVTTARCISKIPVRTSASRSAVGGASWPNADRRCSPPASRLASRTRCSSVRSCFVSSIQSPCSSCRNGAPGVRQETRLPQMAGWWSARARLLPAIHGPALATRGRSRRGRAAFRLLRRDPIGLGSTRRVCSGHRNCVDGCGAPGYLGRGLPVASARNDKTCGHSSASASASDRGDVPANRPVVIDIIPG